VSFSFGKYAAQNEFTPENALPSVVGQSPFIVTLLSPLQPENACAHMLVTLLGIVTLVSPLQPQNAPQPMLVTPAGIDKSPLTNSPLRNRFFA
jgi:hypothetical protein